MPRPTMAKKKKSALQAAASRKLQAIGVPKMTPHELTHMLYHAEERGEVERVATDDGGWAWLLPPGTDGVRQQLKPTPEMLQALEGFAQGIGHNH